MTELFLSSSEKKEFNLHHNELYTLSESDWLNLPCIIFTKEGYKLVDKLSSLEKMYKIQCIAFLSNETFNDYKTRKGITKKNAFTDGLFLLPNNHFFKKYVKPYSI